MRTKAITQKAAIMAAAAALASCNVAGTADRIVVNALEGSIAVVELQSVRKNGNIRVLATGDAFIGRNGLGKEKEGDGKTPVGTFHATTAFGLKPDPGTALPYIGIRQSVYACDEEGPYYNTIIDADTTSHACNGEKMWEVVPEYNYGIAIDYNSANIFPLGSAIFIHCKGTKKSTAGCVAVDESFMLKILKTVTQDTEIIISSSQGRK